MDLGCRAAGAAGSQGAIGSPATSVAVHPGQFAKG